MSSHPALDAANGEPVSGPDVASRDPAPGLPSGSADPDTAPIPVITAPVITAPAAEPVEAEPVAAQPAAAQPAAARPWAAGGWLNRGWLAFPRLPLAAIMVLAIFLRFWQLTAIGFNSDEAVYTGSAASIAGNPTLSTMFPVFRAHPLLFQTLLSVVLRLHDSDWTARGFAAAVGVATVAVTYLLGRRLYGTGPA